MDKQKKTRIGQVISNKMDKTVVVGVETAKRHPIYRKTIKGIIKYKAHDEENSCNEGDTVRIVETRPLSREKRWRVSEIITRKDTVEVKPDEV
ncbi:MAG: 30S ribosomal protein S17 [Dehalococcoidales bacterium]|jgi:small subunit ribosomal protein S17|nr:30S ribosomal protein S17 [Dehalococcoidales bacterium]